MPQKAHIENFLRINGIPHDASDEVIRTALISARWHEKDADVALLVLRDKPTEGHESAPLISARQLFGVDDMRLAPETLTSLLGIEIKLSGKKIKVENVENTVPLRSWKGIYIWMMVFVLIVLCFVAYLALTGYFDDLITRFPTVSEVLQVWK